MGLHAKIQDSESDEYKQDIYHYRISSLLFSLKVLRLFKPWGV